MINFCLLMWTRLAARVMKLDASPIARASRYCRQMATGLNKYLVTVHSRTHSIMPLSTALIEGKPRQRGTSGARHLKRQ